MPERRLPMQIPWSAAHPEKTVTCTAIRLCGPTSNGAAKMESSKDAKEWKNASCSICTLCKLHAMMALDLPQKTISAMNRICRSFLWCAEANSSGGSCAVAWDSVCAPKWAGGLGIPNLGWMNKAVQARWPWLQRSDTSRPWA